MTDTHNCSSQSNSGEFRKYSDILRCKSDMSFLRLLDPERSVYNHTNDDKWQILFYNRFTGIFITSKNKLSETCCVSLNTVSKWFHSQPKRREYFISLSCLYGLDPLKPTEDSLSCSDLLKTFGFEPLNPDTPEDVIYIYLLNLAKRDEQDYKNTEKQYVFSSCMPKYKRLARVIHKKKCDISLTSDFEYSHDAVFCSTYFSSLCNNQLTASKVRQSLTEKLINCGYDNFQAFCSEHSVPASVIDNCSCIFDDTFPVLPLRHDLLCLMLCMELQLDEINEIFNAADYSLLSTIDPFESALIYILSHFMQPDTKDCYNNKEESTITLYYYIRNRLMSYPLSQIFTEEEIDIESILPI